MLKAYDIKTGKEIKAGDTVTDFRGENGVFEMATRAGFAGKSGKIIVDGMEIYDKCYGLVVKNVCSVCENEDNELTAQFCKICGNKF